MLKTSSAPAVTTMPCRDPVRAMVCRMLLGAALPIAAFAAPYVPPSDGVVVQKLGARVSAQERQRRAAMQRGETIDLGAAIAAADLGLRQARATGDPREVGAAQALLAPWWSLENPPPQVRLLRATIAQNQHRFADALKDLDALVVGPATVDAALRRQALLTRATVHQVQGRLDKAKADCTSLQASPSRAGSSDTSRLYAQACLSELMTLQGAPRDGAESLARLQSQSPQSPWLALLRGEMAQRAGDVAAADKNFQLASASGGDIYTIAAHADWLIERGQHAQALALLQTAAGEADAVLLRMAIALKRSQGADAASVATTLRDRLAAARERGTTLHEREEARLALDVDDQPSQAWRLAKLNWQVQKEPADALLYVRAAVAADQRAEALALVKSLQASGWHDVRLAQALSVKR